MMSVSGTRLDDPTLFQPQMTIDRKSTLPRATLNEGLLQLEMPPPVPEREAATGS